LTSFENRLRDRLLDALAGPDGYLGRLLLAIWIQEEAQNLGISEDSISGEFGKKVIEYIKTLEANAAGEVPIERALHLAANGEFEKSGRFIREHLASGAKSLATENIAQKYAGTGFKRLKLAQTLVEKGAEESRTKGQVNRRDVLLACKDLLEKRTNTRRPSVRELAPAIARATELSESTVRRHLTTKEFDKIFSK